MRRRPRKVLGPSRSTKNGAPAILSRADNGPASTRDESAIQSARAAGLVYVSDSTPGFTRQRTGAGFRYVDADGKAIRRAEMLARIKAELFQYIDEAGERRSVESADVNAYLRDITGEDFTAKDFRTWAGTVLAACALREFEAFDSQTQAKRNLVRAIESVAQRLGNTKTICRKCYVHPAIIDAYLDGSLRQSLQTQVQRELKGGLSKMSPEEAAVLAFLQPEEVGAVGSTCRPGRCPLLRQSGHAAAPLQQSGPAIPSPPAWKTWYSQKTSRRGERGRGRGEGGSQWPVHRKRYRSREPYEKVPCLQKHYSGRCSAIAPWEGSRFGVNIPSCGRLRLRGVQGCHRNRWRNASVAKRRRPKAYRGVTSGRLVRDAFLEQGDL